MTSAKRISYALKPSPVDFRERRDDDLIYIDELVIDPDYPKRTPAIKISKFALWSTIHAGLFPRPVYRRRGWLVGDVRTWIAARALL